MSVAILNLVRDTFTDDEVLGKMYINHEFICHTIERPWKDNQKGISCVPEGVYPLKLRYSNVVKKSSGGKYTEGYEVTNVPNRTYIMLHPANYSSQLGGCIAPGLERGNLHGKQAVLQSRDAFDKLMDRLDERNDWEIVISKLEF